MRWFGMTACAVLALGSAAQAQAGIVYQTGFENPPFSPGAINGQNGWFVYSGSSQISDPVVETTLVFNGSQAVSVDGSVSGQTGPVYAPNLTADRVTVSAEIYIGSSTNETGWQFGATGAGGSRFAGGIDIYGNSVVGISGAFPTIGTMTRDAWHDVSITFDYGAQTYDVNLDGSTLASGLAFCGANSGCNGAHVATLGWAIFDSFGNPTGAGNDIGAMDDFSIATIPEPASALVFTAGLAALGLFRRRRP